MTAENPGEKSAGTPDLPVQPGSKELKMQAKSSLAAAGVAAAMRRETGCAVTAVNTDDLRARLQKQGAIV